MKSQSKDLPMDRTERRRLVFYRNLEMVLKREADRAAGRHPPAERVAAVNRRLCAAAAAAKRSAQDIRRIDGVMVDVYGHDGPTFEQSGKHTLQIGESGIIRNTAGTSLARLFNRGTITEEQCRAGEKHNTVWYLASISDTQTSGYGQSAGSGQGISYGIPPTETAAHYRRILREARAFLGRESAEFVEHVCCYDGTMEDVGVKVGNRGGSARRKGAELVKAGLTALVDFYKIEPRRAGRITARGEGRYNWRDRDMESWRK